MGRISLDAVVFAAWLIAGTAASACGSLTLPAVGGGSTAASAGPERTPGVDLVLHAVTVRQNRLVILVANDGVTEFNSPIMVTVSDAPPHQLDLGSPLRSGEALEAVLNTEYVQRRATVAVLVATAAEVDRANLGNNRIETVVGPDQPLDLAIDSVTLDEADGHVVVTVTSRASIPLVGTVTLSVRELPPSNLLLASSDHTLEVATASLQAFHLRTLVRPDLARLIVSISTDAIADADAANDRFPR